MLCDFDFDGTFTDTGAGVFASVQYALRSMGERGLDSGAEIFYQPPLETSFSVKCGLDSERSRGASPGSTANIIRQRAYTS